MSDSDSRLTQVCVLGNFSGRNAGDMAILGCLIKDIADTYPNLHFIVPTINPDFVKNSFPAYSVQPVSLMPWALSLKIFGLPIFRAVLQSDLVLITDNILFDRKLLNPFYNYLSTLSLVLPMASQRGIPVIPYNMSLGPIKTKTGRWCLNQIIENSPLVILRDVQSLNLLDSLEIPHGPVEIRADCALNTEPCDPERLQAIIAKEGLFRNPRGTVAFNVNAYLDAYLREQGNVFDSERFSTVIAETVDKIIEQLGLDVVFIITQVMDHKVNEEIINKIRNRDQVQVVSNRDYSYQELAAIMGKTELLVGMRTHALILASSQGVPVAGIISYPKTVGYLTSIQQDGWMVKLSEVDSQSFYAHIANLYEQRQDVRAAMKPAIEREKRKARDSALLLAPFLKAPIEQPLVFNPAGK